MIPFEIGKKTNTTFTHQTIDHTNIADFMTNPNNYPKDISISNVD